MNPGLTLPQLEGLYFYGMSSYMLMQAGYPHSSVIHFRTVIEETVDPATPCPYELAPFMENVGYISNDDKPRVKCPACGSLVMLNTRKKKTLPCTIRKHRGEDGLTCGAASLTDGSSVMIDHRKITIEELIGIGYCKEEEKTDVGTGHTTDEHTTNTVDENTGYTAKGETGHTVKEEVAGEENEDDDLYDELSFEIFA